MRVGYLHHVVQCIRCSSVNKLVIQCLIQFLIYKSSFFPHVLTIFFNCYIYIFIWNICSRSIYLEYPSRLRFILILNMLVHFIGLS